MLTHCLTEALSHSSQMKEVVGQKDTVPIQDFCTVKCCLEASLWEVSNMNTHFFQAVGGDISETCAQDTRTLRSRAMSDGPLSYTPYADSALMLYLCSFAFMCVLLCAPVT